MTKRGYIFAIAFFLALGLSGVMSGKTAEAASTYTVQAGDCLWSIGSRFGVSVAQLKTANSLSSDLIKVGQVLVIDSSANSSAVSRSGNTVSRGTSRVVATAAQYLGTPYVWGGSSPSGFDCSGFVKYVMADAGVNLPRTAASQFNCGVSVSKSNLLPGDLVFFNCSGGSGIDHVGIYVGDGRFIHSSSPRTGGVIYSSLNEAYYRSRYVGAKRVLR